MILNPPWSPSTAIGHRPTVIGYPHPSGRQLCIPSPWYPESAPTDHPFVWSAYRYWYKSSKMTGNLQNYKRKVIDRTDWIVNFIIIHNLWQPINSSSRIAWLPVLPDTWRSGCFITFIQYWSVFRQSIQKFLLIRNYTGQPLWKLFIIYRFMFFPSIFLFISFIRSLSLPKTSCFCWFSSCCCYWLHLVEAIILPGIFL